jgi:hypothetical protein
MDVTLKSISKYFIDIEMGKGEARWRFTGICGEPRSDKRDVTWKALRVLRYNPGPWLCMGDFNEIMFQHDKQGGVLRPQGCMDKFHSALEDCGLDDLGYSGDTFTWRNHSHMAEGYIRERLDHVVGNKEWCLKFPDYEVINGDPRHSDHRHVILKFIREQIGSSRYLGSETIKFEANWLKEDGYADLVQEAWINSFQGGASSVREGLKEVSKIMFNWSRNVLGDMEKRIKKLKKRWHNVSRVC